MKKMDWGKGIGITITVFITFMLSMVSYLINLDFYMVTNNHYEEGVAYQETIDSKQRAASLENPVVVVFDEKLESLKVVVPNDLIQKSGKGSIDLYRPHNSDLDQKHSLSIDSEGIQLIPVTELEKGKWILKVSWTMEDETYLQEKVVII